MFVFVLLLIVVILIIIGPRIIAPRTIFINSLDFDVIYKSVMGCLADRRALADYNNAEFYNKSHWAVDMPIGHMSLFGGLGELYKWGAANGYTSFRMIKIENDLEWVNKTCGDIAIFACSELTVVTGRERVKTRRSYISCTESNYTLSCDDGTCDVIELYKPAYGRKVKIDKKKVAEATALPIEIINDRIEYFPRIDIFTNLGDFNVTCLNVIYQSKGINIRERLKRRSALMKHIAPDYVEILGDPLTNAVTTWFSDIADDYLNCFNFLSGLTDDKPYFNHYCEKIYEPAKKMVFIINVYNNHIYDKLLEEIKKTNKVEAIIVAGCQSQFEHLGGGINLERNIVKYFLL